jgi:hypothetical protein
MRQASMKKCVFDFHCLCGAVIQFQGELKDHYFKCERMKNHYQELFTIIVQYNQK